MIKISVDTNFNWFGPDKPTVIPFVVDYLKLKAGETVTVYQENEEWDGTVVCDPSAPPEHQWYVQINGEVRTVSEERYEGQKEGFRNGQAFGALGMAHLVAHRMMLDGVAVELVSRYTGLTVERILTRWRKRRPERTDSGTMNSQP